MKTLAIKGHEIPLKITKSGTGRKAVQFTNCIVEDLKKLGIIRDNVEIDVQVLGSKRIPATIEFWYKGYYQRFSYSKAGRFIDNLYMIKELITLEVQEVLNGKKSFEDFLYQFQAETSSKEKSKELINARNLLELSKEESDEKVINDAYKVLARKHHPDLGGDLDKFKEINKAHKLLKKELGHQ